MFSINNPDPSSSRFNPITPQSTPVSKEKTDSEDYSELDNSFSESPVTNKALKSKKISLFKSIEAILDYFPNENYEHKNLKIKTKLEIKQVLDNLSKYEIRELCFYIENNKDRLIKKSIESNQPIYLRSRVSELALNILVSPSSKILLVLKNKGKTNPIQFAGGTTKVKECIDYDTIESLMSLTMVVTPRNMPTAIRSINNSTLYRRIDHLAKTHLVMAYPDTKSKYDKMMLIQDFYSDGDLEMAIKNKKLDENQKLEIAKKFIKVLADLHQNNKIHFDIKPDNIFIRKDEVVIGDIGSIAPRGNLNGLAANAIYAPVELRKYLIASALNSEDKQERKKDIGDGTKVDVFAAGITLFQLFTGTSCQKLPWTNAPEDLEFHEKHEFVISLMEEFHKDFPHSTPLECLLADMVNPDPSKRPSLQEVFEKFASIDLQQIVSFSRSISSKDKSPMNLSD